MEVPSMSRCSPLRPLPALAAVALAACGGAALDIPAVEISPEGATTVDVLQLLLDGAPAAQHPDRDALEIRWSLDGQAREGLDGALSIPAAQTARGQVWRVEVGVPGDDGVRSADRTIANAPPSINAVSLLPAAPRQGQDVTCVPLGWNDADDDAAQYRFAWSTGATTESISTAALEVGAVVSCTITPFDGIDEGDPVSSGNTPLGAGAPVVVSIALPETLFTADDVSATVVLDPDDAGVSVDWRWLVNGVEVSTAAVLPAAQTKKGDEIRVDVTPRRGAILGEAVTSAAVVVSNSPPVVASVTLAPSSARATDAITATATASDADADALTFTYAWTIAGSAVSDVTGAVLPAGRAVRGQAVAVTATASDGADSASLGSAPLTIVNSAPTVPGVRLVGSTGADTLVCEVSTPSTDADGDPITYRWTWSVDGRERDIGGDRVSPEQTREGEVWECQVTASDGIATSAAGRASVRVGGGGEECVYEVRPVDTVSIDYYSGEIVTDEMMVLASDGGSRLSVGWLLFSFDDGIPRDRELSAVELELVVREISGADEHRSPFRLARTSEFMSKWSRFEVSPDALPYERPFDAFGFELTEGTGQRVDIPREVFEEMELRAGIESGWFTVGLQVSEETPGPEARVHGVAGDEYDPILRLTFDGCK
jgi:hypothetical protein